MSHREMLYIDLTGHKRVQKLCAEFLTVHLNSRTEARDVVCAHHHRRGFFRLGISDGCGYEDMPIRNYRSERYRKAGATDEEGRIYDVLHKHMVNSMFSN